MQNLIAFLYIAGAVLAAVVLAEAGRALATYMGFGRHTGKVGSPPATGLPPLERRPHGLHTKYHITKVDGEPVDPRAIYFVLRLDNGANPAHYRASMAAARAYVADVKDQIEMRLVRAGRYDFEPIAQCATDLEMILFERDRGGDQHPGIRPAPSGGETPPGGSIKGRGGPECPDPTVTGKIRVQDPRGSQGPSAG